MRTNRLASAAALLGSMSVTLGASALRPDLKEVKTIEVPAKVGAFSRSVNSVSSDSLRLETSTGLRLATSTADGTVRVWVTETGEWVSRNEYPGETLGAVFAVAFSPDGGSVLAAGLPRAAGRATAVVGEVGTERLKQPLKGTPLAIAAEVGGKRAAVVDNVGGLSVLDADSKAVDFTASTKLKAVAWPKGRIVTGDSDGVISTWDPASGPDPVAGIVTPVPVVALAVLPNQDRMVVAAGTDGTLRIVDPSVATPALVDAHQDIVVASGNGKVLAVGGVQKGVCGGDAKGIIDTWDGSAFKTIDTKHTFPPTQVGVSADGALLAWGNDDKSFGIAESSDGKILFAGIVATGKIVAIAPIPGPMPSVAIGYDTGAIEVIGPTEKNVKSIVATPSPAITALVSMPNNPADLYAASTDGTVRIYHLGGAAPTNLVLGGSSAVRMLAASENRVAAGTDDGQVVVWDPEAPGMTVASFPKQGNGKNVVALALADDDKYVVAGYNGDTSLRVWDVASKAERQKIGVEPSKVAGVTALGSQGGGPKVLVALAGDKVKSLRSQPISVLSVVPTTGTGKILAMISDDEAVYLGFDNGAVRSFGSGGEPKATYDTGSTKKILALASAGKGSDRTLYSLQDGEDKARSGKTSGMALAVDNRLPKDVKALAPLGNQFVAVGFANSEVTVADLSPPNSKLALFGSPGVGLLLAMPDSRQLVVASAADNTAAIWRVLGPTGTPSFLKTVASTGRFFAAAWLGGDRIVLGGDVAPRLRLVDRDGASKASVTLSKAILAIATSPDEKWIAAGGNDKAITVWDAGLTTSKTVAPSPSAVINSLAFDASSNHLASASGTTVTLWKVDGAGAPTSIIADSNTHTAVIKSVAFSKDGTRLATLGADGTLVVWDVSAPTTLTKTFSNKLSGAFGNSVAWVKGGTKEVPDGTLVVGGSDGKAHVFEFIH